jgi:hypothetical protein
MTMEEQPELGEFSQPVVVPDLQQTLEVFESQIKAVAAAAQALREGPLRRKTVASLIADAAQPKLSIKAVLAVLDAMERIEAEHLK